MIAEVSANAGSVVGLRLRIGQDFLGDPLPRDPALIDQFITGADVAAGDHPDLIVIEFSFAIR